MTTNRDTALTAAPAEVPAATRTDREVIASPPTAARLAAVLDLPPSLRSRLASGWPAGSRWRLERPTAPLSTQLRAALARHIDTAPRPGLVASGVDVTWRDPLPPTDSALPPAARHQLQPGQPLRQLIEPPAGPSSR